MNPADAKALRAVLMNKLFIQYGGLRGKQMSKSTFLQDLWRDLSTFTANNKGNSLVQDAVYKLDHGDLIPRAFLILSILYGSYAGERDEMEPIKDFIAMLGEDLDEEELRVCGYADGKTQTFFPELYCLWRNIREVYGMTEFNLSVLPPTPYYAYSLFTLNRPADISSEMRRTTLFGELSVLHHQMKGIVTLANPGATPHLKIVK